MAIQTPKVLDCSVTECSYNTNKVMPRRGHHCRRLHLRHVRYLLQVISERRRDGLTGSVGACKENDCKFNNSLECSAPGIHVANHMGHADCATYSRR